MAHHINETSELPGDSTKGKIPVTLGPGNAVRGMVTKAVESGGKAAITLGFDGHAHDEDGAIIEEKSNPTSETCLLGCNKA